MSGGDKSEPVPALHLRAAQLIEELVGLIGNEEPEGISTEQHGALVQASIIQHELLNGVKPRPLVGNEKAIAMYLHCRKCLHEVMEIAERKGTASPQGYARLSVGWTEQGLQVWCVRHDCNVLHVDFQGCRHPADTTRKGDT